MSNSSMVATARRFFAVLALTAGCAAGAHRAHAAEPAYPAGQGYPTAAASARASSTVLSVGANEGATVRNLDLAIGRSVIVDLPRDAKEVFVGNPAIANAVVRSTRKVFLIGMGNGGTSVFVLDAEGRQIATFEVNVGRDLNVLRQTLRNALPGTRIEVKPAGDSILLTGSVPSAGQAQQAVDIAQAFVGQTGMGGAASPAGSALPGSLVSGGVINALTINGRDQVMLRVTVVEVSRNILKNLGVNVGGNWNVVDVAGKFVNPASTLVGLGTGVTGALLGASGTSIQGQYQTGTATVGGTLTALERAGVSRILAEPTLVAVSGEAATFLVGGEIPISIGCGTVGCVPTITYKQYGISLAFTPVVLSENRISLRVFTEVSQVDRDNEDAVTRTPGFRTRKTSTSIELPSGATMMTAGLINQTSAQTISGVPGLLNLPILGTLFRSRDYQRQETELVVMVTPMIAKPMEAAQVNRPDDGFVEASDPQAVLLGRLTKIYGTVGHTAPSSRSPARFGFITD